MTAGKPLQQRATASKAFLLHRARCRVAACGTFGKLPHSPLLASFPYNRLSKTRVRMPGFWEIAAAV